MVPHKTTIIADPQSPTIILMRGFAAKRAQVFEAWTRPEHIAQWWDPRGRPLADCTMDFRPGGSFRWVNRDDFGNDHAFSGVFRDIAPPERLVLETPMAIGTLLFAETADGTQLTMTLECRSVHDRDQLLKMGVDEGTARTLANLEHFVQAAK